MDVSVVEQSVRRPRYRRASEPPAFRVTEDDVEIVRQVARRRLIRSTEIAALVGRSQDRTNDRLHKLFHGGYVDRPRAQLDRFPTSGTGAMVYALADRGARLLRERDGISFTNMELSRKNREAGRPFIEHQLEIANFQVSLERAVRIRSDMRLLQPEELIAATRQPARVGRDAFTLRGRVTYRGRTHESGVVPDLVFGLAFSDGTRRYYMVEIDRGTMPVRRSDPGQTSFEGKMRTYLAAHAAKQHVRQFGWQSFRVLTVTTDHRRMRSMQDALGGVHVPRSSGASLFWFSTFEELRTGDLLLHGWRNGKDQTERLV
jgi:hypothetical protein